MLNHYFRKFEISRFVFENSGPPKGPTAQDARKPEITPVAPPEDLPKPPEVQETPGQSPEQAAQEAADTTKAEGGEAILQAYEKVLLEKGIENPQLRKTFMAKLDESGKQFSQEVDDWRKKYKAEFQKAAEKGARIMTPQEIIDHAQKWGPVFLENLKNEEGLRNDIGGSLDALAKEGAIPSLSEPAKKDLVDLITKYLLSMKGAFENTLAESRVSKLPQEQQQVFNEYRNMITFEGDKIVFDKTKLQKNPQKQEAVLEKLKGLQDAIDAVGRENTEQASEQKGWLASIIVYIMNLFKNIAKEIELAFKQTGLMKDKKVEKQAASTPEVAKKSPVQGKLKIIKADENFMVAQTETGKDLVAPIDGKVTETGHKKEYGGKYLAFELTDGRQIIFGGLQAESTDVGKTFQAGQPIGKTSETLRIEISKNGAAENPLAFFEGNYERIEGKSAKTKG